MAVAFSRSTAATRYAARAEDRFRTSDLGDEQKDGKSIHPCRVRGIATGSCPSASRPERAKPPVESDWNGNRGTSGTHRRVVIAELPKQTLYGCRYKGIGPRSHRVGKHLRYHWSDVLAWIDGLD